MVWKHTFSASSIMGAWCSMWRTPSICKVDQNTLSSVQKDVCFSWNDMSIVSTILTSCRVELRWHKAHTLSSQLEHQLLFPLSQSILNMLLHTSQKYWEWQSDDHIQKQDAEEAMAIKWVCHYSWPTYHSCHYCINAMKLA